MDIFHYHPITGAFLGAGKADPSPLEKDTWLIPAHATEIKPPVAEDGQQAVYRNDLWVIENLPEPEPEPEPTAQAAVQFPDPAAPLTAAERLEAAGFSLDELRELLLGRPGPV